MPPPVPTTLFCASGRMVEMQRCAADQYDATAIATAVIAGDRAVAAVSVPTTYTPAPL
jgi:hypothetical protein